MEEKVMRLICKIAICCILVLSIARFSYGIARSDKPFTYSQYVYREMSATCQHNNIDIARSWGPVFIVVMKAIQALAPNHTAFVWRLLLLISYGIVIYFLINLMSELAIIYWWKLLLVFLALWFIPAIYNISSGGGEMLLMLSIVGQFYYFYKKKYLLAAFFIVCGIYFKLFPIVFAFPYFVFSICSKAHRRYAFCLIIAGIIVGAIGFLAQGWKYGALYPFSMIFSMKGQLSYMLISKETFTSFSLINKIINGFQIRNMPLTALMSNIAFTLTALLIGLNVFAGWKLSKFEGQWQNNRTRLLHLFIFQAVIGFIFLIFSLEISIEHLLLAIVSLFAPLFLFSANKASISKIIGFLIGLSFIGGLLPLGILNKILPLEWLHQLAGNSPDSLILYEKWVWYHIPMFGIYIIAFVFYFSVKKWKMGK